MKESISPKRIPTTANWLLSTGQGTTCQETVTAIGLTHYRRYFGIKKTPDPLEGVFSLSDWNEFLKESPVILPPKRNYFIETVESQYVHAHHSEDIETLRSVLAEKHSEYLPAFEKLMRGRKTHILNMFVMRRDLFNQYCDWLFDVFVWSREAVGYFLLLR